MSFSKALYNHISQALDDAGSTLALAYGTAEQLTPPYYVQLKVADPEQPEILCESQGAAGESTIQFSVVGESQAGGAEILLEDLKLIVSSIIGDIVYNGNTYSVWNNVTSGVTPLGGSTLNTWDAIFISVLSWSLKS